jgi:hypothetical protein
MLNNICVIADIRNANAIYVYNLYLTGALACSHSKWLHKLDFPVPDWPIVRFPNLKYPLEENVVENRTEESKILEEVYDQSQSYKNSYIISTCM